MIKGISMFSSAGIGELYLKDLEIDIVLANELLEKRVNFYKDMYPNAKVVVGDITKKEVFEEYVHNIPKDIKLLLATPPCQGMSNIGKNKNIKDILNDSRNYLFLKVVELIEAKDFDYILIENVSKFLKMKYVLDNELLEVQEFLKAKFSNEYTIKVDIFNAKDYGVPQSRPRAIIRMHKKHLKWDDPISQKEITVRDAIGHLPSLESGEVSSLKYHYAREHIEDHIRYMKYTPTGMSAMDNLEHYPKKKNGERIKGYKSTYKRMKWDIPAPTVTMRSDAISSQENVHPGRKLEDGTYSDARVLTLRELFIISSIPEELKFPKKYSDTFIRQIIGEAVPPKFLYEILKGIK